MNTIIKINYEICKMIKDHAQMNPLKECGGYLFGSFHSNYDNIIVILNGIYYENRFGSENRFTFSPIYDYKAKVYGELINKNRGDFKLIGCYHSHAQYLPIYSPDDRILQKHYGKNSCTLIYSPVTNELVGEVVDKNLVAHPARITLLRDEKELEGPLLTRKPDKNSIKL